MWLVGGMGRAMTCSRQLFQAKAGTKAGRASSVFAVTAIIGVMSGQGLLVWVGAETGY